MIAFGEDAVFIVKNPTRGATAASVEECGPGHVLAPFTEARHQHVVYIIILAPFTEAQHQHVVYMIILAPFTESVLHLC